jgi:hypothetical protein
MGVEAEGDARLEIAGDPVRFVITSGTGIREIVEERAGARAAYRHVVNLVLLKRPGIRIFDADGHRVSLEKLRELAKREATEHANRPAHSG